MVDTNYKEFDLAEEIDKWDIQPLGERIVIRELQVEQVGRILMPTENEQMRTNEGYVIAVGPDVMWAEVGDRVYYGKYSGFWLPRFGEEETYRMMNDTDLLGKVISKTNGALNE